MSGSRRRIKLEMSDSNGDKLTLTFEGRVTREKIIQLADFVELYGGGDEGEMAVPLQESKKVEKLRRIVDRYFPFSVFSSKEVLEVYVSEFREPISLSTVSTYLMRLANRGFLERVSEYGSVRYRLNRAKKLGKSITSEHQSEAKTDGDVLFR